MKMLPILCPIALVVAGGFWILNYFEAPPANSSEESYNQAARPESATDANSLKKISPVRNSDVSDDERISMKSNSIDVLEINGTEVIAKLEAAIESEAGFSKLQPLYELSYDMCNNQFNAVYGGTTAAHLDAALVPKTECSSIKSLLHAALDKSTDLDERILLVEMLTRWEPLDMQLDFIRSHAIHAPMITGATLAALERNALYITSSVEAKRSVINTFSKLSRDSKIESAHEFFQTFVPLVTADASQGVTEYFPQLEAVADSFPVPEIPDQTEKAELLKMAEQIPEFTNEQDFRQWAKENPDLFAETLNGIESHNSDQVFTGALTRIDLSISLLGQVPSPMSVSASIENEPNDVIVYHALSELSALKNEGQYFTDYFNKIQQNDLVRARVEILLQNPSITDGQRSSVQNLYDEIWQTS